MYFCRSDIRLYSYDFMLPFRIYALKPVPPPDSVPLDCPNDLCNAKADGNYEMPLKPNQFLQCSSGNAYCQSCWPTSLVYVSKCNQCLYSEGSECIAEQK